jgi:hypothetical protein
MVKLRWMTSLKPIFNETEDLISRQIMGVEERFRIYGKG